MKEKNQEKEIQRLANIRDHYQTKAFWMMLEIAFVFGLPAAGAFFLGRKLDSIYGTGRTIILSLLVGAFILSWVIVIIRYRQLDRELKKADKDFQEAMKKRREEEILEKNS
jgi:ATP/ADP translocase